MAFIMPLTVPAPPYDEPIAVAFHVPLVSVPTLVSDDVTTLEFSVVPVRVPAAAVTVIFDAPVKATPLIFAPGESAEAVAALPVVFWFRVGKSAATAIVKAPVDVVLFRMPVARADVPAE